MLGSQLVCHQVGLLKCLLQISVPISREQNALALCSSYNILEGEQLGSKDKFRVESDFVCSKIQLLIQGATESFSKFVTF